MVKMDLWWECIDFTLKLFFDLNNIDLNKDLNVKYLNKDLNVK